MGFTTETFLFAFLPISVIIYFLINISHSDALKNAFLVVISLFFYVWADIDTAIFIFIAIILTYVFGKIIARCEGTWRKVALGFFVIISAGALIFYKYYSLLNSDGENSFLNSILVPVSVSFIIFNIISYAVDIYRKDADAGSLLDTALFISFFPKLISGPIVPWKKFDNQIHNRNISRDKITRGIDQVIIGFAKKAIIADTLGQVIDDITSASYAGVPASVYWLKVILYGFQLYYDFAGYSDIAIGLARIFGFDFEDNFNSPYASTSIGEFWRRWHISLGAWFREYVYFPLGGSKRGNVYINVMIVFILTGLWHGSTLTFLVFGLIHGVVNCFERLINKTAFYKKTPSIVKWAFTIAVTFFAWIFFMNAHLSDSISYLKIMFLGNNSFETYNYTLAYFINAKLIFTLGVAAIGSVLFSGKLHDKIISKCDSSFAFKTVARVLLLVLFGISIMYIVNQDYSPFIYFQF